jgi:curved DNA-binding protein CbpA
MSRIDVEAALKCALQLRASPFARLGLPDAPCDQITLRRAYKARALLIHPDKCKHAQSKIAFQQLSEAFDTLTQPGGIQKILAEIAQKHKSAQRVSHRSEDTEAIQEEIDEDGQRGGRRWWDAGWSEFERRLRQKEAEAVQLEAVEKAERQGDDALDAYMSFINDEALQGMHAGFRDNAPSMDSKQSKDGNGSNPPPGSKRPHNDSGGPRRPCKFVPFHDSGASGGKRKAGAAFRADHIDVKLATGAVISVARDNKQTHEQSREAPGITALGHLDSDESELSE